MAKRKILYGYQIMHGDLVIQEEECLTVQNVFTSYLAGLSYQTLADRMNADNIPFSQESPLWNKHKIKRMLENSRYAGENGYPPIIDQDTFQQVQEYGKSCEADAVRLACSGPAGQADIPEKFV